MTTARKVSFALEKGHESSPKGACEVTGPWRGGWGSLWMEYLHVAPRIKGTRGVAEHGLGEPRQHQGHRANATVAKVHLVTYRSGAALLGPTVPTPELTLPSPGWGEACRWKEGAL